MALFKNIYPNNANYIKVRNYYRGYLIIYLVLFLIYYKFMKQKTQKLSFIPIVVISLFYFSYLLKWEPVLLGVFKELLLLPSVLAQISLVFIF